MLKTLGSYLVESSRNYTLAKLWIPCRWLAPEVILGEPHTFASDVFSFGVILWEVLTWQVPWSSISFWQVR